MAQALRYHGTAEHGELIPGWPADHISEDWITAKAAAEGRTVEAVLAEGLAYKRVDGQPLYTETARAKADLGDVAPERPAASDDKPRVPLGHRPKP